MILKPTDRIPQLSDSAVEDLIKAHAPKELGSPRWLKDLIQTAYQNGRYYEASAETFSMAMD